MIDILCNFMYYEIAKSVAQNLQYPRLLLGIFLRKYLIFGILITNYWTFRLTFQPAII